MVDSGIGLQIQCKLLSRLCTGTQEHLPVVHIDPLHRLPVYKQQKLRILGIPSLNLGTHIEPHSLSLKLLRHLIDSLKPVMAVLPVPVHGIAVKILPCANRRILGPDEKSLSVLPAVDCKALLYLKPLELLADYPDPLVQKMHIRLLSARFTGLTISFILPNRTCNFHR